MPYKKDVKTELESLAKRATARRVAHPANKTNADAQTEKQNFSELEEYIYKNITEDLFDQEGVWRAGSLSAEKWTK